MGEIGRVQRPDPAINAPNLLGRVHQSGDQKHRHPHDENQPKEDVVELHEEELAEVKPTVAREDKEPPHGLDLAV